MGGWLSQKIMSLLGPSEKITLFFSLKLRFSDRAECGNIDVAVAGLRRTFAVASGNIDM